MIRSEKRQGWVAVKGQWNGVGEYGAMREFSFRADRLESVRI